MCCVWGETINILQLIISRAPTTSSLVPLPSYVAWEQGTIKASYCNVIGQDGDPTCNVIDHCSDLAAYCQIQMCEGLLANLFLHGTSNCSTDLLQPLNFFAMKCESAMFFKTKSVSELGEWLKQECFTPHFWSYYLVFSALARFARFGVYGIRDSIFVPFLHSLCFVLFVEKFFLVMVY